MDDEDRQRAVRAETPTALRLVLFSGFRLFFPEGREVASLGRRERAMLAYLALCPGQREARNRLATLLWSNRQDEQARHSLAQSTAAIRKALDDADKRVLVTDADTVSLDEAAFDVDAIAFQALFADGSRDALVRAAGLYAGDLLPGFETRSEGFDQWLDGERNRFRTMAVDVLSRLMTLHADAGDWQSAIATATRVLDLDILREEAHRVLMIAYARTGRRTLALQQYKSVVEVLGRELQVDPDPETTELIAAIRGGVEIGPEKAARGSAPAASAGEDAAEILLPAGGAPEGEPPAARLPAERGRKAWIHWSSGGVVLALVAAVIGIVATSWRIPELAPAPLGAYVRDVKEVLAPDPLSIAVLPFESHGDPDAEEFADALSEGLTTALSMSSEMVVLSRSSLRGYGDAPAADRDVARDLNVRYVLEGGVRKWGDQIGIEIGLIDTFKGPHRIWSESYHRQAGDFISLQQDITFEVITSLKIRLTEGEQERINRAHGTRNLEAWLAAAQGEKHLRRITAGDVAVARAYYERAVALDPDYPGAWAGLGWTYFLDARFAWTADRAAAILKAGEMAERAFALDPDRPRTYSLLGGLKLVAGDFPKAVSLGEKAVSLGANDADAAALLAFTLTYTGEPQRALALIERSIRLRPHPPLWYSWLLGRANRLAGRLEAAVEVLSAESQAAAPSIVPLVELAAAYSEMNRPSLARGIGEELMRRFPEFTIRSWIAMPPYKDPEERVREVDDLRSAGLRE